MQEVITRDVPVILFVGKDEQRPLAERAARFLPKVCANYTVIDSSELPLNGIDEQFRGILSPLVIRSVMNRIDAWLEIELRHPRSIRRYYRQFDY
jgi:fructoselysine-6-phosphate deglycase